MGRFREDERATWYFGGGSSSAVLRAALGLDRAGLVTFEGALKVVGAPDVDTNAASSASAGLDAFGAEDAGRCEGRTGVGAGALGLLAWVAASAARVVEKRKSCSQGTRRGSANGRSGSSSGCIRGIAAAEGVEVQQSEKRDGQHQSFSAAGVVASTFDFVSPTTTSNLRPHHPHRTACPLGTRAPLRSATPPREEQPSMASAAANGESVADKYSLLPQMMPHFDRHLLYPLLNFPPPAEDEEQPIEKQKVLFALLKPTYMTGYVGQLAQNINNLDHVPDEYLQKQEQEKQRLAELEASTVKIMELLTDETVLGGLRSDKQQNLAFLEKEHGVTVQMVEQLYEEAQFKYGCGLYGDAADILTRYRILVCLIPFA